MLEERIAELTKAVEALTRALGERADAGLTVQQPTTEQAEASEGLPVTEPVSLPEPDDDGIPYSTDTPTREQLRALCLSIVRENRDAKPKVKDAIAAVGGKMVDDVPEEKLAELETSLRAIA